MDLETVCCMCGDVGFPDKLFRCAKCHHRFQHSYVFIYLYISFIMYIYIYVCTYIYICHHDLDLSYPSWNFMFPCHIHRYPSTRNHHPPTPRPATTTMGQGNILGSQPHQHIIMISTNDYYNTSKFNFFF